MTTDTARPVLEVSDLTFSWDGKTDFIDVKHFEINPGESVFLRGPSGSGKSTLLGLLSGVLAPKSGLISINGQNIASASSSVRDKVRADSLGIIFQQFNLLPYLSVLGNVQLPCRFSKTRKARSKENHPFSEAEAKALLKGLGLPDDVINTPVANLSVGQQQRVAVARALIGAPDLIIADEPTSALDTENRDQFIELLNKQRQLFNTSLLFVSHDRELAKHFDRVVDLMELNKANRKVTT